MKTIYQSNYDARPELEALVAEFSPTTIHIVDSEDEIDSLSLRSQFARDGVAWDATEEILWTLPPRASDAQGVVDDARSRWTQLATGRTARP